MTMTIDQLRAAISEQRNGFTHSLPDAQEYAALIGQLLQPHIEPLMADCRKLIADSLTASGGLQDSIDHITGIAAGAISDLVSNLEATREETE